MPKKKTPKPTQSQSTPNGYDPRWIEAINSVMESRDSEVRLADLNDDLWDNFLGPLCDAVEDGDFPANLLRNKI